MRTRFAIPILALSASVMALGLGLAEAQSPPTLPRPHAPGVARNPLKLSPRQIAQGGGADPGTPPPPPRPANMPLPPPPPSAGPTSGGGAAPSGAAHAKITPFETGIEYEPVTPGAHVTFNLEDADLPELVRLVSSLTGKRFILPGAKAHAIKATVYAPTKVTVAEAYQAFLSILDMNGMTVVPSGRYLKIVETGGVESQPLNTFTNGEATPVDDRYITRMHRLENIAAEDAATLIAKFKSHEGNITAYAPTNTLIITDTGTNIRRMLHIIEAIDLPRAGEQVWIEPIHYATAADLADRLTQIFPPDQPTSGGGAGAHPPAPPPVQRSEAGGGDGASTVGARIGEMRVTKIIADERTNSLIIVATERAYMRILEMIRELDVALEGEGRVHVHYVQHGDAEDIAQALSTVVGGGSGGGGGGAGHPASASAPNGSPFEGQVHVTAHKPTNSLVITSTLHDYAALRNVIERLDVERKQVFIEAVIMELQVKRGSKFGLSFHGGVPNSPDNGALSLFGFGAGGTLNPFVPNQQAGTQDLLTGLALGIRGPTVTESQQLIGLSIPAFGVVLTALATTGDVNVLSTPHIMAMDNVEATISVGENVALQQSSGSPLGALGALGGLAGGQTGQTGTTGSSPLGALGALGGLGMGGGFGMAGAGARQDVGTKIKVTPHINASNDIRLEIDEEISERGAAEGLLQVIPITKRLAKTQLVVRDQQTVVIGGLMRDTINTQETKVPILGDIPLLGMLFRRTQHDTQKTNLLLFLTPYIIRGPEDLRTIFERKMRERQDFIDRFFVFGDQNYEPPRDYSRTRGLLAEILMELDKLSEEERIRIEAAEIPAPDHVPHAPLGSRRAAPPQGGNGPVAGDVVIGPNGVEPIGQANPEDGALPPPPPPAIVGEPLSPTPMPE